MREVVLPLVQELGGRAIPAVDLHITLCFLGQVAPEKVAGLIRSMDRIDPATAVIMLDRIDWWRGSQVLCLLPLAQGPWLQRLAANIRDACLDAGLAPDAKPFRPHVTLARKAGPLAAGRSWPGMLPHALPFTAHGFALMQSAGAGDGPRYEVVHAWEPGSSAPRRLPGS